jgi:hypothetical protein
MKFSKWSVSIFLIISFLLFTVPTVGVAGEAAFKDETNAKIARIKAKQKRMERSNRAQGIDPGRGDSSKCGSVEIGNINNERGATSPKEVTVIVTGDVINTDNNCR